MMKINIYITPILVFLLFQSVSAQWHPGKSVASITPWEIGLSGGVSSFVTSINPGPGAPNSSINYWNRDVNPGIGLSVVRNISPIVGIEIDWLNTRLTGSWNNKWPPLPISTGHAIPSPFKSQINQFDLMGVFNLNQMMLPGEDEDIWHLFIKPGVGFTNIKNFDKFEWGSNYTNTRISLVLDAGLSFSVNPSLKLMIGDAIRSVITDNLDGVFVVSEGTNGKPVNWMKVYELYNFSYVKVSYCLDNIGSIKSKSTFKNRKGKYRVYRR